MEFGRWSHLAQIGYKMKQHLARDNDGNKLLLQMSLRLSGDMEKIRTCARVYLTVKIMFQTMYSVSCLLNNQTLCIKSTGICFGKL